MLRPHWVGRKSRHAGRRDLQRAVPAARRRASQAPGASGAAPTDRRVDGAPPNRDAHVAESRARPRHSPRYSSSISWFGGRCLAARFKPTVCRPSRGQDTSCRPACRQSELEAPSPPPLHRRLQGPGVEVGFGHTASMGRSSSRKTLHSGARNSARRGGRRNGLRIYVPLTRICDTNQADLTNVVLTHRSELSDTLIFRSGVQILVSLVSDWCQDSLHLVSTVPSDDL